MKNLTIKLKNLMKAEGADLVGIAPSIRLAGAPAGHRPTDILVGAKSVVVVGLHLTHSAYDGLPGSRLLYTSQVYVANDILGVLAFKAARMLEAAGYNSLPIPVRGYADKKLFGIISHRHAVAAAGLGEFSLANLIITPEYGLRVRFVTVITEAPLEGDELSSLKLCEKAQEKCGLACVKNCPVEALSTDGKLNKSRCHTYQKEGMEREMHGSELMCGMCIQGCPVGRLI
jgi:epoxyqueuosine reductase